MAGSNPFDTGTDAAASSADAAKIRKRFEAREPLVPGMETGEAPPDFEDGNPDAQVRVQLDAQKMKATVTVRAPEEGGKPLGKEMLSQALKESGVATGLDQKALVKLLLPTYDEPVVVARGTKPVDGKDGACEELFSRELPLQPIKNGAKPVDYGEAGVFRDLKAGTLVCRLTPATPGKDGVNVLGEAVRAQGKSPAAAPVGEGVEVLPDGKRAVMVVPGNLVFREGRFVVEDTLRLDSLPYSPGIIRFSGHVVVECDLPDGFSVDAGGDVTLLGSAGDVQVSAKGSIRLLGEVRGAASTLLEAKQDIEAGLVVDATLQAGGGIKAAGLLDCTAECDGDVEITAEAGVLAGGKLTTFGSVEARVVGEDNSRLTAVVLGVTPRQLAERARLRGKLEDVQRHIESLQKDEAIAARLEKDGRPVPPEKDQARKRAALQLPICAKKKEQIEQDIADFEEMLAGVAGSTFQAGAVLPPLKISIGGRSTNIIEKRGATRAALDSRGELVLTET